MTRNSHAGIAKKLTALLIAALMTVTMAGTAFAASDKNADDQAPPTEPLAFRTEEVEIQTYLAGASYPMELLKTIRDAMMNGTADNIDIYDYRIAPSEVSDLLAAVRDAYPMEYAAMGVSRYGWSYSGGVIYSLSLYENANFDDNLTAAQRYDKLCKIVNPVVKKASGMSNYEKVICIHDWLVLNSQYDETYERSTAYQLLTEGTAVCQGYADSFKLFMDLLGVPSLVISSNDMNHAWNMVKLGGQWYHIDVTWDDPVPDKAGVTRYTHTLLNDSEITAEDHYGWSADVTSSSTAYSNMPRGTGMTQYWRNNLWYYKDNGAISSCDQYGNNSSVLVSGVTGGFAMYDDVILYGGTAEIKTYWQESALTGTFYSLTEEEKAKSDYAFSENLNILSLSVNDSGTLSYTYRIWVRKTGTNSYTSSSASGQSPVTLAAFFTPVYQINAALDATSMPPSAAQELAAARNAVALYGNMSEEQRSNISPASRDKLSYFLNNPDAIAAPALAITAQPEPFVGAPGDTATFTVTATGEKLTYQWQLSDDQGQTWRNSSVKAASYSTTLSKTNDGRGVRCIVTDGSGASVTSETAFMSISPNIFGITEHPQSVTSLAGKTVTFKVVASGSVYGYQWQLSDNQGKTWSNSKNTTDTYTTTLTAEKSGRYVRCIVTSVTGATKTSNAAYMKVSSLAITGQPTAVTALKGDTVTFNVTAKGPGITYQWQLSDDQGKTWRNSSTKAATYNTTLSDKNSGRYVRCVVTDKYGNSVKSNATYMKISSLAITGQPKNASGKSGDLVKFTVTAKGPGITYQWQLSDDAGKTWRNSKNTTSGYSTTLSTSNNGRCVRCIVTDKYGNKIKSNAASMKIK
ncbi:MAG: hypothetical protein II828_00010 [Clostridia bacterium]|nr:hypothetical protein [Clostridia bacterium]